MSDLQSILDRLPDEAHRNSFLRLMNEAGIKEGSMDLHLLAIEHEARWGAVEAMQSMRKQIVNDLDAHYDAVKSTLEDLPGAMKSAGAEIVNGLASEIAVSTTEAIKNDTLKMMHTVAKLMESHSSEMSAAATKAATDASKTAQTEVLKATATLTTVSSKIANAALELSDLTPFRLGQIGVGLIAALLFFVIGAGSDLFHEHATCGSRVANLTYKLSARDQNRYRNDVCAPLIRLP